MRIRLARLLAALLFKALPPGTSMKVWKWSDGAGNAQEFPCPNKGDRSPCTWKLIGEPTWLTKCLDETDIVCS